jgi:hypothetical protein
MSFKKMLVPILLFSFFLSGCALFVRPDRLYIRSVKKHPTYDAIIVPGVPFFAPDIDRIMVLRLLWAKHLYDKGMTKNIIMSGSAVYSPYVEAEIMKRLAIGMGIPEEHIFTEERAEHSTENVWYGYKLARSLGFKTVALATDRFQSKLLYRFGRRRTPELGFLPANYDTVGVMNHQIPAIEYKDIEIKPFTPLPDRESKWQRLRGTNGKHINYKDKWVEDSKK